MNDLNNDLWEKIKARFESSNRKIIFNTIETKNYKSLEDLKINYDSVLGSIILNSSGIIIDDWIRILGSEGSNNKGITWYNQILEIEDMFIIAYDIVGGIFAIDKSTKMYEIHYFAPDTLEWENLEINYTQFINWVLEGDIDLFYNTMRWDSWKVDCEKVKFDEGILIYPFLWSEELKINESYKKIISIDELFHINQKNADVIIGK